MDNLEQLIRSEIAVINQTLAAYRIDAGTHPSGAWTMVAGTSYISYGLRLGATQTIDGIERRLSELMERISRNRRQHTPVALRVSPLALEVPHPNPQPLPWIRARLRLPSYTMLVGRNYTVSPAVDDTIDLRRYPHVLVAGTTGSGKSTLVRMMLLSLAVNTHPDDLSMVLIDMKNTDLASLRTLPHVERFAVMDDAAGRAIRHVESILRQRIERQISEPKLLLAIDELRELARLPGVINSLGSIVSLGRSLGIHVVAATQHPKASEIGSVVKANFPIRLIGQVVGARHAEAAADRPGTGAELLPGDGAFLRIDGPHLVRVQAYWLDDAGTASLIDLVRRTYAAPVRTSVEPLSVPVQAEAQESAPVRTSVAAPVVAPSAAVEFPLPRRAPTAAEAAEIRRLRTELGSLNQTIIAVYGSKSSDTHRWVSEALAAQAEPEPAPILRMGVRA